MNIVLTNDDGLSCPGILRLAELLRSRTSHEIFVLAPDSNRSGVSHAVSLNRPVRIVKKAERTWTCSGTPADCVMTACFGGLGIKPDLVLSGINAGANLGTDIIYSGTAAAARQAGLCGVPGIALSLCAFEEPFFWDQAVEFSVAHLEELRALWASGLFINVNIPNIPDGSGKMAFTFPSKRQYQDRLVVLNADASISAASAEDVIAGRAPEADILIDFGDIETEPEEGSDCDAVDRGLVAVSQVFLHPLAHKG
jgi:5'-nucleotidase